MQDLERWVDENFKVTARRGDERNILCPLHDDQMSSASINIEKGLFKCMVCGGRHVSKLAKELGLITPFTKKEYVTYDYHNKDGKLIYQVKRYIDNAGKKTFRLFDPARQEYGIGTIERVPYNLPGILKAVSEGKPVMICEGEKDCDTLISRDYAATTNNGGCGSTKYWEGFIKYFPTGTVVYVFPDHDEPGMKHAERVGEILSGVGCDVRMVDLGYSIAEKHGKDISDWATEKKRMRSEFLALLEGARGLKKVDDLGGDIGYARELEGFFRNHLKWSIQKGTWMIFDGKVWRECEEEKTAVIASEKLVEIYRKKIEIDKTNVLRYKAGIKAACEFHRVKRVLGFLRGWKGIAAKAEDWDINQWLLNVENGTIDLKTLELREHDPEDMLTKIAPMKYDPEASDGWWTAHLEYFLPNDNIRREVQRNLGLGLVGASLEEILPIWHGTGGNGKTTTQNIIHRILGDYVRNTSASLITAKKKSEHPEAIADLAGARFVFCSEISKGNRLDEGLIKNLTGGETKRSRHLYGRRFDFAQTFTVFLLVNDKPRITGTDDGVWRRIRLIPWTVKVDENKRLSQDEVLRRLQGCGSAILNWMIAGLKDYESDPHWIAPEVREATAAYRSGENSAAGFLAAVVEDGGEVYADILYEAYGTWCMKNNEESVEKRVFNKFMKEHGYKSTGSNGGKIWHGITLARTDDLFKQAEKKVEIKAEAKKDAEEILQEIFGEIKPDF